MDGMDKRSRTSVVKGEIRTLKEAYWSAAEKDRPPLLLKLNEALAELATLEKPTERTRERTEQTPMRLTKAEKRLLTKAAKVGDTTVADLCRSGGLLNAALILDLPKQ